MSYLWHHSFNPTLETSSQVCLIVLKTHPHVKTIFFIIQIKFAYSKIYLKYKI